MARRDPEREKRLAAALRDNLRKRKAAQNAAGDAIDTADQASPDTGRPRS